jgi:hypothetical protein
VILVAAGLLGFYICSNYDSIFGLNTTTSLNYQMANPINTSNAPLGTETLLQDYVQFPNSSNITYTNHAAYVTGYVGNMEQSSSGVYESCYDPASNGSTSCPSTGVIIWIWNGESNVTKVKAGTVMTAECVIEGLSGGNLVLTLCTLSS